MIAVIADDLTGAAEVAGIACTYGLKTELLIGVEERLPLCDVVVIATNTRSMTKDDAVAYTRLVASNLNNEHIKVFKKTDSALRGHVMEELSAILSVLPFSQVLYVPANPSKKRIIRDGIYYIDGKPISETDFSRDPEFPAVTSSLKERFPQAKQLNICMPDICSEKDILPLVSALSADTLLAGAADLFNVWLQSQGYVRRCGHFRWSIQKKRMVVVCGSTQSNPPQVGMAIVPMPREVYDGMASVSLWWKQIYPIYKRHKAVILTIPYVHLTGHEVAMRLRKAIADIVRWIVSESCPEELVVEGGATAYACLDALSWHEFRVIGEFAPGVVRMSALNDTVVTLKPGSYSWGGFF